MEFISKEQVNGKVLDHLGLIAVSIEKLGLIDKIDSRLPVSVNKGSKVSMGKRMAAMVLNGLGFIDDRLYMFADFLSNKPIDRLLGEGIEAEQFNDDMLGRFLDAVYRYGTTKLFTEVAFEIGIENNLLGNSAHFDTSSLSVYGEYDKEAATVTENTEKTTTTTSSQGSEKKSPMNITYGYSKNNRYDLKQMVINLATTGAANFPIWMEAHSGNASDKKVLINAAKRMKTFCNSLKNVPDFLYVGDSAFYENCVKHTGYHLSLEKIDVQEKLEKRTLYLFQDETLQYKVIKKNRKGDLKLESGILSKELLEAKHYNHVLTCLSRGDKKLDAKTQEAVFKGLSSLGYSPASGMKWLSRVPAHIKAAKALLSKPHSEFLWADQGNGYHITPILSNYGEVDQRWILVYSEQAFSRETKTLEKHINKEREGLKKALRALSKKAYKCQEDADTAAKQSIEKIKYHRITFTISEHKQKRNINKKLEKETISDSDMQYHVSWEISRDEEKVALFRREKGRFILATNEFDTKKVPDEAILPEYKSQSGTESGFKFIKGDAFEISSIFLKKPERIEALMMVMTLCLMVYSFAQYFLREALEKTNATLPNQLKKPTKKPSMSWIFRMFHGVHLLYIKFSDYTQELVINLTEIPKKVIAFFGVRAKQIYGLCDTG